MLVSFHEWALTVVFLFSQVFQLPVMNYENDLTDWVVFIPKYV